MTDPQTIPVIVGVADLAWGRAGSPAEPREPLELIGAAAQQALDDTGVPDLGHHVDAIYAVKTASWAYDHLPALIADRIGASSPRTVTSTIGGHWPTALLDRIGSEIADGSSSVALLIGGEAQASVKALMKSGTDPGSLGWVVEPGGMPTFSPEDLGSIEMQRAGALTPTRVYPLFENRLGYELGQTPQQSLASSAELYSDFSDIASGHPCAWSPNTRSADDIGTPGVGNRLVSDAYPLAMNAMPFVDQAAAVVICSLAIATEFGVAEDRLVYLWGGAGASDTADILARSTFGSTPALESAAGRTLSQAGVDAADLSIVDAYSCFPVVPKLLIRTLGLPDRSVPSVLGGHSFFGGPLNSYTLHSIAEVTRLLRTDDSDAVALVHGNGGYLTHQHTVLMSRRAHRRGYVGDPTPRVISANVPPPAHDYDGDAEIFTATVEYDRAGLPAVGVVIASTPDGRRVAGHTDSADAAALIAYTNGGTRSLIGAHIRITDRGGLLAVSIEDEAHS
ncbi:acetyl-CoA acetyltransferase [Rhodococcus fascians]|nr:acetyl-CoA acetyltransferase [Rhodococcus fascians]